MQPPPGTATEEDLIVASRPVVELVDGVLVEKAVGTREALLAGEVLRLVGNFVAEQDRGVVLPPDGMLRLEPGVVRIPDVSFIPWDRIPGGRMPDEPIASLVPDLAVEVLSEGNTRKEIDRKLREYFFAGARLAWVIDPRKQTARIYTSPTEYRHVGKGGNLEGGAVLPGFRLHLPDLFARLEQRRRA